MPLARYLKKWRREGESPLVEEPEELSVRKWNVPAIAGTFQLFEGVDTSALFFRRFWQYFGNEKGVSSRVRGCNLRFAMRRINKMGMARSQIASELVQCLVANEHAGRDVHHSIFGVGFPNCGPPACWITLAENFRKIAVE